MQKELILKIWKARGRVIAIPFTTAFDPLAKVTVERIEGVVRKRVFLLPEIWSEAPVSRILLFMR